jgi:hypothetical protein
MARTPIHPGEHLAATHGCLVQVHQTDNDLAGIAPSGIDDLLLKNKQVRKSKRSLCIGRWHGSDTNHQCLGVSLPATAEGAIELHQRQ